MTQLLSKYFQQGNLQLQLLDVDVFPHCCFPSQISTVDLLRRTLGFLMSSVWHFPPAVTNCRVNFTDPEGYIDSSDDPPLPEGAFLQCTYTVTVYTGYGVELQVHFNMRFEYCFH